MQLRKKQMGMGMLSLAYFLGTAGAMIFVGLKVYPVYLNEMKLVRAVKNTAADVSAADPDGGSTKIKRELGRRWAIEDIAEIKPADVKIKPVAGGRVLAYDYWNQVELIQNVYLSFHFVKEFPIGGGASD